MAESARGGGGPPVLGPRSERTRPSPPRLVAGGVVGLGNVGLIVYWAAVIGTVVGAAEALERPTRVKSRAASARVPRPFPGRRRRRRTREDLARH